MKEAYAVRRTVPASAEMQAEIDRLLSEGMAVPRLGGPRPVLQPRQQRRPSTDIDRQHLYRIKYQQTDPNTLDKEVTAA
jgi:hypothetical protein